MLGAFPIVVSEKNMATSVLIMKKSSKVDPDELNATHYRTTWKQFEYLSRSAFQAGHNSIKKVIDERVFDRKWMTKLEELRQQHRKLGIKDFNFWPAVVRKRLGYKVEMGRPKKPRPSGRRD